MKNLFATLKNFFNKNKILILLSVALFYTPSTIAQNYATIGTGTSTASSRLMYGYYTDGRSQFYFDKNELVASGLGAGDAITELSWNLRSGDVGWVFDNSNIKMGIQNSNPSSFVSSGLTDQWSGIHVLQAGWNTITLSTPYIWDGVSGVVIQYCFDNLGFSNGPYNYWYYTSATSTVKYYYDDLALSSGCSMTSYYSSSYRPNIKFTYTTGGGGHGGTAGLWTGATSPAWSVGSNWDDGNVPTGSVAVTIPSGTSNPPYVDISNAACASLTVQSGATLYCISGSAKLTASTVTINSGGKIHISAGEIESAGKVDWDGNVTMTGGILDVNNEIELSSTTTETISGGTITLTTTWDGASCTSGFTPTGGTVYWDHASITDQKVYAGSGCYFNNVTINGDVDQWSSVRIKGDLHILNKYDWDIYSENLYLEGDLITDAIGTTSYNNQDGRFFATGNSYFYLEGSANQSIGSFSDGGIYIYVNKTGGTVTQNGYIYAKYFYLGINSSSTQTGTWLIDNETLKMNYYYYLYAGTMNVTGGLLHEQRNSNNYGLFIYDPAVLNVSGGEVRIGDPSGDYYADLNMLGGALNISGGTVNICDELDVSSTSTNTITISGGTLNIGSYTGTSNGSYADRFEMDGGTLNLDGGAINIKGQYPSSSYDALDLASAVTVNATTSNTITLLPDAGSSNQNMYLDINGNELGNLLINNSGYTVYAEDALDIKGNLTISGGAILNKGSQNINIEGSFINSGGTLISSGGYYTFDGAGNVTCDAISDAAARLYISKTSGGTVTTTEDSDFDRVYLNSGSYIIDGETITSDNYTIVQGGTLQITSGLFHHTNAVDYRFQITSGTVDIDGGEIRIGTLASTPLPDLYMTGGGVRYFWRDIKYFRCSLFTFFRYNNTDRRKHKCWCIYWDWYP